MRLSRNFCVYVRNIIFYRWKLLIWRSTTSLNQSSSLLLKFVGNRSSTASHSPKVHIVLPHFFQNLRPVLWTSKGFFAHWKRKDDLEIIKNYLKTWNWYIFSKKIKILEKKKCSEQWKQSETSLRRRWAELKMVLKLRHLEGWACLQEEESFSFPEPISCIQFSGSIFCSSFESKLRFFFLSVTSLF